MSQAQQNTSGAPLGDSQFLLHKEGIGIAILFPSLTTPCLVKWGHPMTVLVAVHKSAVRDKEKQTVPARKKIPIDAETARLFHSHLRIVPWGNNKFPFSGNMPPDQKYMTHLGILKNRMHMVYHSHMSAIEAHNNGDYNGWFLGELPPSGDYLVHAYDHKQQEYPFGVLHSEVVQLYAEKGYTYLFQLQFKNFEKKHGIYEGQEKGVLLELVSLYLNYEALQEVNDITMLNLCCLKPNDEMYLQYVEEMIMKDIETKKPVHPSIDEQKTPPICESQTLPLHKTEMHPEDLKVYKLPHGQDTLTPQSDPDGYTLCSRHPVYIASKTCLDIGVVSDFHLSTRQELFSMVKAEVIPGLAAYEEEKNGQTEESLTGSPASSEYYIGKMALNSRESTSDLLQKVSATADLIVMTGDIYDYSRNYNHVTFLEKAKERGTGVITGDIWEAMDFDKHKKKPTVYPRYMDLFSVLSLIYARYAAGKPVFYVSGNHEGYQSPYGILPRAFGFIPTDTGIPADNNLTAYEAALIFGPSAKDLDKYANFSKEVVASLYPLLTPWRDCLVNYGDQQNLALLGWGDSEDMAGPFMSTLGDGLPRADTACSNNQMELLKELATRPAKANVVVSHFTFLCYNGIHPLRDKKRELPAGTVDERENTLIPGASETFIPGVLSNQNRGSFSYRAKRVYELLDSGKIHFTISGHAHRSGVYAFGQLPPEAKADAFFPSRPEEERKLPVIPLTPRAGSYIPSLAGAFSHFSIPPSNRPVALVCGSSGPLSRQNMDGEFHAQGIEPPQGLVLNPATREVRFVKSTHKAAKPRLAVLMEYLWFAGVRPFVTLSHSIFCLNNEPFKTRYFNFVLGEKWAELFCPQALRQGRAIQPEGLPIREIVFHVVDKKAGEYVGQFPMTLRSITPRDTDLLVTLSKTLEDFNDFREQITNYTRNIENELYFISISFRDTVVHLSKNYTISNPWCFPVNIKYNSSHIYFMRERDLPDYRSFADFKEYKMHKKTDSRYISSW